MAANLGEGEGGARSEGASLDPTTYHPSTFHYQPVTQQLPLACHDVVCAGGVCVFVFFT